MKTWVDKTILAFCALSCATMLSVTAYVGHDAWAQHHKKPAEIVEATAATIKGPTKPIKPGRVAKFDASAIVSEGEPAYSWCVKPDPVDTEFELFDGGKRMWFFGEAGIEYTVILATYEKQPSGKLGVTQRETKVRWLSDTPAPDPVPPKPVDPPKPVVPSFRITDKGFAVLIIEETGDRSRLPAQQLNAMMSADARSYIRTHCVKGPDGKTPEFRMFDHDLIGAGIAHESTTWQAALSRGCVDANGKFPWLIVSNSTDGVSVPFPANETDYLSILKKYGGQ
jgi:hypothetical protein